MGPGGFSMAEAIAMLECETDPARLREVIEAIDLGFAEQQERRERAAARAMTAPGRPPEPVRSAPPERRNGPAQPGPRRPGTGFPPSPPPPGRVGDPGRAPAGQSREFGPAGGRGFGPGGIGVPVAGVRPQEPTGGEPGPTAADGPRKRPSYLVEVDPDGGLFGSDQLAAPPVIGAG